MSMLLEDLCIELDSKILYSYMDTQ